MDRTIRIKKAMDDCAAALGAEGVKYFIGVVDRDTSAPDGGKCYSQSDAKGEDMKLILDITLPTLQDVINLGIWVGAILRDRREIAKRSVTAKPKKNGKKN